MPEEYATIEIRRERGILRVVGFGRTPRGQKYIKKSEVLEVPSLAAPNFKDKLAIAIKNLEGETP